MTGARVLVLLLAVLLLVAGGLWTYQGLGLGGGAQSSAAVWGALLAGLGVALAITVLGSVRRR